MKFFFKVLLCTTLVIAIVCSVGGYALLASSFESDIGREVQRGLDEYQLTRFAFESGLLSAKVQYSEVTDDMMKTIVKQAAQAAGDQSLAVYDGDGGRLASVPEAFEATLPVQNIGDGEQHYRISDDSGAYMLEVAGSLTYDGRTYYLVAARDVSDIFVKRESLMRFFIYLDLAMIAAGALLISGLSFLLTRPIRKLKHSAARIADGRYTERADVHTKDEIGELAASFNHMAAAVEQNVAALKRYAQQQQDFVANFSHELKTPLTSIIGYADLLRSEKLDAPDAFKASSFIFSEGKRLEAMSLKLLDMIVLERQQFALRPIAIRVLLERVAEGMAPLLAQSGLSLTLDAEKRIVLGESDLLMTLIINLIDNGRKASDGGRLVLTGRMEGEQYRVSVRDFGRGIPPEELSRITEAFYMVDKSRARAQHGAGLGLSIAERIARIHGTALSFESAPGKGTTVSFALGVAQGAGKGEAE